VTATIWADVLDKLYDLTVAESFIAEEIAAQRLFVSDGPLINDFAGRSILVIGGIPVDDDESEVTSEWTWATMGRSGTNADVDDRFLVPCGISTVIGQNDLRSARRITIGIFSAVAQLMRSDAMSAQLPQVMWCIPQITSLKQLSTGDGSECSLTFGIHVLTRI
jgi:hypothetical protein